jgi:hypothetical protein
MYWRVRHAITMAIINVGKIIAKPNGRHIMHQLISLNSQKTICRFSILRKRMGML